MHGLDLSFMKTKESQDHIARMRERHAEERRERQFRGKRSDLKTPYFMADIQPFVSVATQDPVVISSRKQLRDYERAHNIRQVGDDIRAADIIAENAAKKAQWEADAATVEHGWIDPDV
jgi:hypothetical protein